MAIFMAAVLILLGYRWWCCQQELKASAIQLKDLICEARTVSQEMEAMLDSAVDLSRTVIDDFDIRIKEAQSLPTLTTSTAAPPIPDPVAQFYHDLFKEADPDGAHQPETETPASEEGIAAETAMLDDNDYQAYREMHPTLAVYQLYQRGLNAKQIAQILQRGQGEIHLILNLARKKKMG